MGMISFWVKEENERERERGGEGGKDSMKIL